MEEKLSYEQAVKRLEEIVDALEAGDTTLENSLNLFTEGMNLVKICNNYLDKAEDKIKVLVDNKLEDFYPSEGV